MTAEEARRKLKAAKAREKLRGALADDSQVEWENIVDWAVNNLGRPALKGAVESTAMLARGLPTGITAPSGEQVIGQLRDAGILGPTGEDATGVIPRAAEIAGGAALPVGGMMGAGRGVLKSVEPAARSFGQRAFAGMAERPGRTIASEITAALTGAGAGELATLATGSESARLPGEVVGGGIGGIGPALVGDIAKRLPLVNYIRRMFDPEGATDIAASELQRRAVNPENIAIDTQSAISPARQTGQPRLIGLQEKVYKEADPEAVTLARQQEEAAVRQAQRDAVNFGGDPEALADVGSGRTTRKVSEGVRERTDAAMRKARDKETEAWDAWRAEGKDADAAFDNYDDALDEIMRNRTLMANPADMPEFVADARAIRQQIDELGRNPTAGEVQDLRSRALESWRKAKRGDDANFNKARIANKLQRALLKDLEQSDGSSSELFGKAIKASRELNETFTEGEVGHALSRSSRGVETVSAENTIDNIIKSTEAKRGLEQLMRAHPENRADVMDYIRSGFNESGGTDSVAKAESYLKRLRDKGIFDLFPEMESELRASAVPSLIGNRNGPQMARKVITAVGNDAQKMRDVKTAFAKSLMDKSARGKVTVDGDPIYSAGQYSKLLRENESTMKALGFTDPEIQRVKATAKAMRAVEREPSSVDVVEKIVKDPGSAFLDWAAAIVAARIGGKMGGGSMGGSIQTAGRSARFSKLFLDFLAKRRPERIIIDAHFDKELYQALMTRGTDSKSKWRTAERVINGWMQSVLAQEAAEMESRPEAATDEDQ